MQLLEEAYHSQRPGDHQGKSEMFNDLQGKSKLFKEGLLQKLRDRKEKEKKDEENGVKDKDKQPPEIKADEKPSLKVDGDALLRAREEMALADDKNESIRMREVGYDSDTGVSTMLIEKTDENGKKRTFLAGTKNFGKTSRQKKAEIEAGTKTEDTEVITKTQRQCNAEGMLKALQNDSVDFARSSGTIDLAESKSPEKTISEVTAGMSARVKCEEEVENEWKKLETMMKALPAEAKRKLYESRVGNDPDKDLTMEEYDEMMAIIAPYLPSIPDIFSFKTKEIAEKKTSGETTTEATSKTLTKTSCEEEGAECHEWKEMGEEGPKCKVDKEMAGGSETISGLIEHFRNEILGKHFEIRHIKTQSWMNSRICKVEDVSVKKSIFDPRVVCTIKGEADDKRYSLKLTNMVDYMADIDDIVGECCVAGKEFKETRNVLHTSYITRELHDAMQWLATKDTRRNHQIHR